MKKIYVLDTNVVLYDPQAMFRFDDNEVVIPITVIEEVDNFKKDVNEIGRNARQFSRMLDRLRHSASGNLTKGVPLEKGGLLRVDLGQGVGDRLSKVLIKNKADMIILGIALDVKERSKGAKVVFLTKDTNLRIQADVLGIDARDYEPNVVEIDDLYSGWRELRWPHSQIDELMAKRELPLQDSDVSPNELLLIRSKESESHSALGRVVKQQNLVRALSDFKRPVWGIQPRNLEQTFALDLLLDDSISLITLVGKAGTGKTLLALAAALYKVAEEQKYQRVLVSRPVFPLGRDLGFLPGDIEEKLLPWMQPIFDNIELLMSASSARDRRRPAGNYRYQELMELGMLAIEPLTYIRGRSIPNQFMVVDEAQNLTPHEIKTIITRAGHNTKVVLTGDPYQIDNPYVDASSNGLTYVVERFRQEAMSGHITLVKGERSPLAERASDLL